MRCITIYRALKLLIRERAPIGVIAVAKKKSCSSVLLYDPLLNRVVARKFMYVNKYFSRFRYTVKEKKTRKAQFIYSRDLQQPNTRYLDYRVEEKILLFCTATASILSVQM